MAKRKRKSGRHQAVQARQDHSVAQSRLDAFTRLPDLAAVLDGKEGEYGIEKAANEGSNAGFQRALDRIVIEDSAPPILELPVTGRPRTGIDQVYDPVERDRFVKEIGDEMGVALGTRQPVGELFDNLHRMASAEDDAQARAEAMAQGIDVDTLHEVMGEDYTAKPFGQRSLADINPEKLAQFVGQEAALEYAGLRSKIKNRASTPATKRAMEIVRDAYRVAVARRDALDDQVEHLRGKRDRIRDEIVDAVIQQEDRRRTELDALRSLGLINGQGGRSDG